MKFLLVLLSVGLAGAQVADKANERYRTKQGRQGMLGILGSPERAGQLQGEKIVRALGLQSGMTVADLGTGGGAMLPLLSAAVGAKGHVLAEDIFQDFLDRARTEHAALANVAYVLGTERDPKLPEASCDVAVTIDAYHHYDYPAEMLDHIRRALKPGGRFVVIDYYRRAGAMGNGQDALTHIRIDRDEVVKEVEARGFKLLDVREHVPGSQYMAIFAR